MRVINLEQHAKPFRKMLKATGEISLMKPGILSKDSNEHRCINLCHSKFDVPRGAMWDGGGVAILDKFPCFEIKPNVPDYYIRIDVSFSCWEI